jgi:hypothetical protein
MNLRAALLGAFLLAAFDGPTAQADTVNEYNNIHTVAVISEIGDSLTIGRVGSTAFTNNQMSLPILEWGVDDTIRKLATEALSIRFTVKPLDPAAIKTPLDIEHFIQSIPPESTADAYVVISDLGWKDPYTSSYLSGLGLYRHDPTFGFLGGTHYAIYAYYRVDVIDGRTGKKIDYGTARMNDRGPAFNAPPFETTDGANWADTPDAITDAQKSAIKDQLLKLIATSMPFTLRSANLIPKSSSD